MARLRDSFLPEDPRSALFCTYGLDARFFEAEILPATFPVRLTLDRESGSRAAYFAAADAALQAAPVLVFFDHLTDDGPGLPYVAARVDVKPRAFQPKLMVLEYEDRFRVAVSSANLTRPAWTSLLELFIVEDLKPGEPHSWSAPLRRFLGHLERFLVPERRADLQQFLSGLVTVPAGEAGSRLLSSWDGPLLTQIGSGLGQVRRVDVVTPFFEGEEGRGILEQLEALGDKPRGRLYVSAHAAEERLEVRGPRDKIDALLETARWDLHRVAEEWRGDQDGAPLRALHGKMLALCDSSRCRVIVGSANVTRAAMLHAAPAGNVELVVSSDTTSARLVHMLPQATPLEREDVDIVDRGDPTGEDDDTAAGAERWVEAAVYWVAEESVELRLSDGAPTLAVSYEGLALGVASVNPSRFPVLLRESLSIEVTDGQTSGLVPLVIADPAAFTPRGSSTAVDFETFCELLAGAREAEMPVGELPRPGDGSLVDEGALSPRHGAIPWRRILAAVDGLGATLVEEAPFPRGVEFVLRNPMKLAGFQRRLDGEVAAGRFLHADHAYALHETRRMLDRVVREIESAYPDQSDSRALVHAELKRVRERYEVIRAEAPDDLAPQLRILESELSG
jgi:hypothetical protein